MALHDQGGSSSSSSSSSSSGCGGGGGGGASEVAASLLVASLLVVLASVSRDMTAPEVAVTLHGLACLRVQWCDAPATTLAPAAAAAAAVPNVLVLGAEAGATLLARLECRSPTSAELGEHQCCNLVWTQGQMGLSFVEPSTLHARSSMYTTTTAINVMGCTLTRLEGRHRQHCRSCQCRLHRHRH